LFETITGLQLARSVDRREHNLQETLDAQLWKAHHGGAFCEIDLRVLFQQSKANDEKMDDGKIFLPSIFSSSAFLIDRPNESEATPRWTLPA